MRQLSSLLGGSRRDQGVYLSHHSNSYQDQEKVLRIDTTQYILRILTQGIHFCCQNDRKMPGSCTAKALNEHFSTIQLFLVFLHVY